MNDFKLKSAILFHEMDKSLAYFNIIATKINELLMELKFKTFHPALISNGELSKTISYFNSISKHAKFPIPLGKGNLGDLAHIATNIKCGIVEQKFLIEFEVPLVSVVEYRLYNVVPIPTFLNIQNHVVSLYIKPSDNYFAVSSNGYYFGTNYKEMINCNETRFGFTCVQEKEVHYKNEKSSCEYSLLKNAGENNFRSCNVMMKFAAQPYWVRYGSKQNWIYSLYESEPMTVSCDKTPDTENLLNGTGILELK